MLVMIRIVVILDAVVTIIVVYRDLFVTSLRFEFESLTPRSLWHRSVACTAAFGSADALWCATSYAAVDTGGDIYTYGERGCFCLFCSFKPSDSRQHGS